MPVEEDTGRGIGISHVPGQLSSCTNLAECGGVLAWGFGSGILSFEKMVAGPSRAAGPKFRPGGLFPLPVSVPIGSQL